MTAGGAPIRVGCCAGLADAALVRDAGYDYIELPVGTLMSAADDAAFHRVAAEIATLGIAAETTNLFIPATLPIVGPDADPEKVYAYAATALRRMGELGVRVCVFGSGGARSVPDGWERARALDQLAAFLAVVEQESAANGVRVVIEPLNHGESNVFNAVAESDQFAQARGVPGITVLADLYHMSVDNETYDGMRAAGDRLVHAHVADADRSPPGEGNGAYYDGFFRTLREIGYRGTVSIEARWRATDDEARLIERRRALAFVRQAWDQSGS